MTTLALSLNDHKKLFAERVRPVVERHAKIVFRFLRRFGDDRDEAVADCMAHAWQGYTSAVRVGKQPWTFPTMLATFAARKTRMRRKVGKPIKSSDVYNAAKSHRLALNRLADNPGGQEPVADAKGTPVPEQVAFRLDFAAWLSTLSPRNRLIVRSLPLAESAQKVAEQFGLTPGRLTQLRQEFMSSWLRFAA